MRVRLPEGDPALGAVHLQLPDRALEERHRRPGFAGSVSSRDLRVPRSAARHIPDHRLFALQAADRRAGTLRDRRMEHADMDHQFAKFANIRSTIILCVHHETIVFLFVLYARF